MNSFTDADARVWPVQINVATIKRTQKLAGVDLMESVTGHLLERIAQEPVLLCDVLYCVCKEVADERKVTDEDFGRLLAGDVIDEATKAFMEALVAFFPSRRRLVLEKAIKKLHHLEEMVMTAAEERLDGDLIDRKMEAALRESGEAFINSQPSVESIPTTTPSEKSSGSPTPSAESNGATPPAS